MGLALKTLQKKRRATRLGKPASLWLTCLMRVIASGNLTVELIRAQRFEVGHRMHTLAQQQPALHDCDKHDHNSRHSQIDRVELSPQAMESDPWAMPAERAGHAAALTMIAEAERLPDEQAVGPRRLSPVVGSPALAGLGAAWIVPGTLLDVVA